MPLQWVFLVVASQFIISHKTAHDSAPIIAPNGNSVYLREKYKRHESA
jgi:hypothetical protein